MALNDDYYILQVKSIISVNKEPYINVYSINTYYINYNLIFSL